MSRTTQPRLTALDEFVLNPLDGDAAERLESAINEVDDWLQRGAPSSATTGGAR